MQLTSDSVRDASIRSAYIEDTAKMLADVLFTGEAYYVIVRGREPGVTRTNWYAPVSNLPCSSSISKRC